MTVQALLGAGVYFFHIFCLHFSWSFLDFFFSCFFCNNILSGYTITIAPFLQSFLLFFPFSSLSSHAPPFFCSDFFLRYFIKKKKKRKKENFFLRWGLWFIYINSLQHPHLIFASWKAPSFHNFTISEEERCVSKKKKKNTFPFCTFFLFSFFLGFCL